MNSRCIILPEIGKIRITKRINCKRLSISINNNRIVKVSIPLRTNFSDGERFLFEKIDWIKHNIQKMETFKKKPLIIDENTLFSTRSRKLLLIKSNCNNIYLKLTSSEIQIHFPSNTEIISTYSQNSIKALINNAMRIEANEYLPGRVEQLANKHGYKYNSVKIRNSKTRWGSCSGMNNINLSLYLVRLPDFLSDYVILHELVHTVCKNHGSMFWCAMEKVVENAKEKSKQLKKIGLVEI